MQPTPTKMSAVVLPPRLEVLPDNRVSIEAHGLGRMVLAAQLNRRPHVTAVSNDHSSLGASVTHI